MHWRGEGDGGGALEVDHRATRKVAVHAEGAEAEERQYRCLLYPYLLVCAVAETLLGAAGGLMSMELQIC